MVLVATARCCWRPPASPPSPHKGQERRWRWPCLDGFGGARSMGSQTCASSYLPSSLFMGTSSFNFLIWIASFIHLRFLWPSLSMILMLSKKGNDGDETISRENTRCYSQGDVFLKFWWRLDKLRNNGGKHKFMAHYGNFLLQWELNLQTTKSARRVKTY